MTTMAPETAVNPSEIRLGNWFEHHPVWSHRNDIKCADPDRFVFQWEERDWSAVGEGLFSIDCISPIPITAEILVKSGFCESNSLYIIPEVLHGDTVYIKAKCGDLFHFYFIETVDGALIFQLNSQMDKKMKIFVGNKLPHIRYVHQIQNIYYSITGRELEIKWK